MIKQVRFARSIRFFEEGFLQKWGVNPYHDKSAPCLFAGVYSDLDVGVINEHKGFKVVLNTGALRPEFSNINPENVVVCRSKQQAFDLPYKTKDATFPLKDYSMFQPVKLGNHIYIYIRKEQQREIMGAGVIQSLRLPYPVIYGEVSIGAVLMKIERAYNFYNHSFVNIKLTESGGWTTATEMAYMGRMTISNSKAPFCIGYESNEEMRELIIKEAEKIGTVQPSCIVDFFDTGEEWKQVKFWI